MNHVAIAALLDDDLVTIVVRFQQDRNTNLNKQYTFLCKKTLAETLKEQDAVLVNTVNGIKIATVVEIDEDTDVDINRNYSYNWAFQKVNTIYLESLQIGLEDMKTKIKGAQRKKARQQALEALGLDHLALDKSEVREELTDWQKETSKEDTFIK